MVARDADLVIRRPARPETVAEPLATDMFTTIGDFMKFSRVPPAPEQLTLFLRIVNAPAHQPVYVHCAGGRHRTGVMTAVYRMEQDGWTADQLPR